MNSSKTSLLPGIFLIGLGLILLVHKLNLFSFSWPLTYPAIFMLIGIILLANAIFTKNSSAMFWGTVFFLIGLLFFLRNYGFIEYYYMDEIWPVFFIIFGIAFFVLFIVRPHEWGVLIPGGIFLFIGISFLLRNFHLWRAEEFIARYWPLVLIVIGIGVILGGLRKREEN